MGTRLLALLICLVLCSFASAAQDPKQQQPPDLPGKPREGRWGDSQESAVPEDMRRRMAMERAESDHRKILDDVTSFTASLEVARLYENRYVRTMTKR